MGFEVKSHRGLRGVKLRILRVEGFISWGFEGFSSLCRFNSRKVWGVLGALHSTTPKLP